MLQADFGPFDYKVVGSAGDGFGFYASQGTNKHAFEKTAVLTQDIDLNIFINSLVPQKRHLVESATGFTWIILSQAEVHLSK